MDNNGSWSHKPGQARATDLDDSNHTITDPRTANTGVYEFVYFMTTANSSKEETEFPENEILCGCKCFPRTDTGEERKFK